MLPKPDDGHKAKTARRIVEVLEFFDETHREATVMDIVRRYNRPQSSTSELLATLVEVGLLYKDNRSRYYTLTPRAAILGSVAQPKLVRDGTLSIIVDQLVEKTGLSVAVFGQVGLNTQIFRWTVGTQNVGESIGRLCNGAQERLSDGAAGLLLLSTVEAERRAGMLRRLNAEASEDRKFVPSEMNVRIQECALHGGVSGAVGFDASAHASAILLPGESVARPIALGFVYQPSDEIDPAQLIAQLRETVRNVIDDVPRAREPMPVAMLCAA